MKGGSSKVVTTLGLAIGQSSIELSHTLLTVLTETVTTLSCDSVPMIGFGLSYEAA